MPPLDRLPVERYAAGRKSKMIQSTLTDNTYILHVPDPSLPSPNKYKIYDSVTDKWINGVFPSQDFDISEFKVSGAGDERCYVRGPLGKFLATIQCGDYAFSIKPKTTNGISWKEEAGYINEELSVVLYRTKNNDNIQTTDTNSFELSCDNNAISYPTDYIESSTIVETPYAVLKNLPFNFMTESPLSYQYYDYDKKQTIGASFKLKNMYDLDWNVDSQVCMDPVTGNLVGTITNTRTYTNVGVGGHRVWITYKVGDTYSGEENCLRVTEEDVTDIRMTVSDEERTMEYNVCSGLQISSNGPFDNTIPPPEVSLVQTTPPCHPDAHMKYEYVEVVKGDIKTRSAAIDGLHKTNIYSISITDSGLNDDIDETIRQYVQSGINKVIREIAGKTAPANTQLWKIIWEGK